MGTSARLSTEAESNDEEDLIAVFDSEDPLRAPDSIKLKKKKKKKNRGGKVKPTIYFSWEQLFFIRPSQQNTWYRSEIKVGGSK